MGKKHKKHHKMDRMERTLPGPGEEVKPIKLVLKVGGIPEPVAESMASDYSESERRHKHKKKKKKKSSDREKDKDRHHKHRDSAEKLEKHKKDRKREREPEEAVDVPAELKPPPVKRTLVMEPDPVYEPVMRPLREKRPDYGGSQLQACLEYLHKQLQRKDVNGFFGYPVTDSIAPGYSNIIHHPMDFSSMKNKIEGNEYRSVTDYKKDFKLMCDNCAIYNRPETVYYKEAKRLLSIGLKMMSKEKLILMKKNLSFMSTISNEELGVDLNEPVDVESMETTDCTNVLRKALSTKPKSKAKPKLSKFEAIPDNLTPEEILAQAQEAAGEAAQELTLRKPRSKIGFLRKRPDGSTSLNIINPDNDGIVNNKERVVNLGVLVGKLSSGSGTIPGFKEDKRNKATPVNYLNYGPFSSYAPSYDSSFTNLSKEDTDLLLATYGDETGLQYSLSLKSFVEKAGNYTNWIVDSLLNVLTGNEHSKANQLLQQKKKDEEQRQQKEDERRAAAEAAQQQAADVDFKSLRSLSDLGIDTAFLDSFENTLGTPSKSEEESRIDAKLRETSVLLQDLQQTQNERLSKRAPWHHLAHVPKPSEKETKLAEKVTQHLTELAREAMPSDIASVEALRSAMGMTTGPTDGTALSDDENEEDTQSQKDGNVLTHLSSDQDVPQDPDRDLAEFFETGPTLRVLDSPSMQHADVGPQDSSEEPASS